MGKIDRELLRLAQERVFMWERELEGCHPDDHRRQNQVQERLTEARNKLSDRLRYHEERHRRMWGLILS